MNTESPNKTETLFGGRLVTVLHEDNTTEEIKVRQLRLVDYERAFALIEDEIALAAFCCIAVGPEAKPVPFEKKWIIGTPPEHKDALQPECYEALQAVAREVNAKGFFSYALRRADKEREAKEQIIRSLAELPADTLKLVAEVGKSTSPTSLPKPQRIPG